MNQHHPGIHHISAIAGDPQQNLDFYVGVLGLRLVKKTVNFDDPSVYHLYYGDETGSPGTILTFFPWSRAVKGKPDRGEVVAISFSVPTGSLEYWKNRISDSQLEIEEPFKRFGKNVLGLKDPDGLHLELVADPAADEVEGWRNGDVPDEHAIRGVHGATLSEADYRPTGELLENHLGFEYVEQFGDRHLYRSDAPFGSYIEVIDRFDLQGRSGKGTVHHIAFRAKDDEHQLSLREELQKRGYHITEVKDRHYFRSVYFHEPGGVLFEIATDNPGFDIDEEAEQLGTSLKLPGWLEDRRGLIEADLPDLEH